MFRRVPDPLPSRAVLLRHELPDGTIHFDLLLQREGGQDRPLAAFRVQSAIDNPDVRHFGAERIGDHRPAYLDYEGEVSGGRGRVRRWAVGTCFILTDAEERFFAVVDFREGQRILDGRRGPDGRWQFSIRPPDGEKAS